MPKKKSRSLKTMKASAAPEAYEDLFEATQVTATICFIIVDNDSSMKFFLMHHTAATPKEDLAPTFSFILLKKCSRFCATDTNNMYINHCHMEGRSGTGESYTMWIPRMV